MNPYFFGVLYNFFKKPNVKYVASGWQTFQKKNMAELNGEW